MGALDWSPVAEKNATADPIIEAREGASARSFPESLQGLMAGVAALAADQGGGLVTTGLANAYEVASMSGVARLRAGLTLLITFDRTNTGLATLNVDGTGPKPLTSIDGTALVAGQLKAGRFVSVTFDATARVWRTDILASIDNTSDAQKVSDTSSPIGGALQALATGKADATALASTNQTVSQIGLALGGKADTTALTATNQTVAQIGVTLAGKADTVAIPGLPIAARIGAITAPYKRPIQDHFGDMANLRDATSTRNGGEINVIPFMDSIRRDSPWCPFFAPPGRYRVDGPLPVVQGAPLSIYGVGSNGDGPAATDYTNSTLFLLNFGQGNVFEAVSLFPCIFENFRFESDVQFRQGFGGNYQNTGAAISVSGGTLGTNAGSRVRNVGFAYKDIGVRLNKCALPTVEDCSFLGWGTAGVSHDTTSADEGSGGFICHNRFFGHASPAGIIPGPCIYSATGYVWIYCNNLTGGTYGIYLGISDRAAGAPRIFRNTIEDWYICGVFATSDGTVCAMLEVEDNEFSMVEDRASLLGCVYTAERETPWLKGFSVSRNRMRNNFGSRAPSVPYIAIRGGVGGKVNGNILTHLGANVQAGITISGASSNGALGGPMEAFDNQFYAENGGSFSYRVAMALALARVRDHQGLLASELGTAYPNALRNGSEVWVNDGAPASSPVTGGGPGTMARYIGGRWRGGNEAA